MRRVRLVSAVAVLVPGVGLTGVLLPSTASAITPPAVATPTATFTAVADASVREDAPDANFGGARTLRADGSPRAESYLRFQTDGLTGPVSRAVLQVYSLSTSDTGVAARPVTAGWSEEAVTWTSRPAVGDVTARSGATREGHWASIDVTALVTGNGTVDLAVTSSAPSSRSLRAREAGTTAPRLVVETATATTAPTPPPPASTTTAVTTTVASADTTVREDLPTAAYGAALSLRTDGSPRAESYLRFPVPVLTAPVKRAVLEAYSNTSSDDGVVVRPVGPDWSEADTTWATKPTVGKVVGRSGATREGQWMSVDVTSLVRSGVTLDLAVTSGSRHARAFRSTESTRAPRLVVETTAATIAPTPEPTPPPMIDHPVIAAAGDIACDPASTYFAAGEGRDDRCQQQATSDLLLDDDVRQVLTLGDNQYEAATLAAFRASYDPSWGRVKEKTRPAIGNHEYRTTGAAGYFGYFGDVAGEPGKGYYSYDVGDWHLVALNSNCTEVGGCGAGSAQERWLRADLAAHPRACTLAYWHHPTFSSGKHGNNRSTVPLYQALQHAGAEVVLAGHDHSYERFGRQTAAGVADPARGLRSFVVGTGGKNHYAFEGVKPNSEFRDGTSHGVLKLTLRPDGYDWQFVQAGTRTVRDAGSDSCR